MSGSTVSLLPSAAWTRSAQGASLLETAASGSRSRLRPKWQPGLVEKDLEDVDGLFCSCPDQQLSKLQSGC